MGGADVVWTAHGHGNDVRAATPSDRSPHRHPPLQIVHPTPSDRSPTHSDPRQLSSDKKSEPSEGENPWNELCV